MHLCNSRTENPNSAAATLVTEMLADPNGKFSPSIYETARLVSLTPSLTGHERRVRFLVDQQEPDGGWGGPEGYHLVPTLSATEALLSRLRYEPSRTEGVAGPASVASSVERGLRALTELLRLPDRALPDTVAIEIIVPGLIADINAHLDGIETLPAGPLPTWRTGRRLGPPAGLNTDRMTKLRAAVHQGSALPTKLLHSLEVLGAAAEGAECAELTRDNVGCSPAATAAWLGDRVVRADHHPSVRYLREVQDETGAVPVAAPLALFERSWVLSTLTGAGISVPVHDGLLASVREALGESGAGGGHGLPPDADDTASALYTLALLGDPQPPDQLWPFQEGEHFSTFPDERTPSTTTNAHVLEAFGASLRLDTTERARNLDTIGKLTGWLCDQQEADGSWQDKWHASPYYATKCCAQALESYGGATAAPAVGKAVDWLLASQRTDGSWGRWGGTFEETAFAVQTLARTRAKRPGQAIERAAARGYAFLRSWDETREHPPMWHDKDLYTPARIVHVEGLAALHLAQRNSRVAALLPQLDEGAALPEEAP